MDRVQRTEEREEALLVPLKYDQDGKTKISNDRMVDIL